MKFSEAMDKLKSGSKVTRKPWCKDLYFKIEFGTVKTYQPSLSHYIYNDDIMISEGWVVEGKETEILSFYQIIPYLREGKRAWLMEWDCSYIQLDKTNHELLFHTMAVFPFVPSFNDFVAEDWEEIA